MFWDHKIHVGQDFDEVIEQAIEQARCMIVGWSQVSKKSDWVRGEADIGRQRRILVPVLFETVTPPIAFRSLHTEDFSEWQGESDAPAFLALCQALSKRLGAATPSSLPYESTPTPTKPDNKRKFAWRKPLSGMLIAVSVIFATFIWGGYRVFYGPTNDNNAGNAQNAESTGSGSTERSVAKNPKEKQPVVLENTNDSVADKPQNGLLVPAMKRLPSGIAMSIYEVTQAEWRSVMGSNPSNFKECDTCPVENVSWNDVQDFIKKLNLRSDKNYRLPTEDEWFTACQAGQSTEYCGSDNIDYVAWYNKNTSNRTYPVGKKLPNDWGLYDMSGNVWEWTDTCYEADCSERVRRGGSWNYDSDNLCSSNRGRFNAVNRYNNIGFRLAHN